MSQYFNNNDFNKMHMLGLQQPQMLNRGPMMGNNYMRQPMTPQFDMMSNPNIQGPSGANINLGATPAGPNWAGLAGMAGQMLLKQNQPQQAVSQRLQKRENGNRRHL